MAAGALVPTAGMISQQCPPNFLVTGDERESNAERAEASRRLGGTCCLNLPERVGWVIMVTMDWVLVLCERLGVGGWSNGLKELSERELTSAEDCLRAERRKKKKGREKIRSGKSGENDRRIATLRFPANRSEGEIQRKELGKGEVLAELW